MPHAPASKPCTVCKGTGREIPPPNWFRNLVAVCAVLALAIIAAGIWIVATRN